MLDELFTRHKELNYVQGFHDVASVFYMVAGEQVGFELLEAVALQHLRCGSLL